VSAATVEATLAVELAVELELLPATAPAAAAFCAEAALDALSRLYRPEAWLPLTLPIDIINLEYGCSNHSYRPRFEELEEILLGARPHREVPRVRSTQR
jgi:hypothetical protein